MPFAGCAGGRFCCVGIHPLSDDKPPNRGPIRQRTLLIPKASHALRLTAGLLTRFIRAAFPPDGRQWRTRARNSLKTNSYGHSSGLAPDSLFICGTACRQTPSTDCKANKIIGTAKYNREILFNKLLIPRPDAARPPAQPRPDRDSAAGRSANHRPAVERRCQPDGNFRNFAQSQPECSLWNLQYSKA